MNYITLDSTFAASLAKWKEPVELRNPDGKIIGIFRPSEKSEEEIIADLRSSFDLEKAKEILAREHGQGKPLKEVWEIIKAREAQK